MIITNYLLLYYHHCYYPHASPPSSSSYRSHIIIVIMMISIVWLFVLNHSLINYQITNKTIVLQLKKRGQYVLAVRTLIQVQCFRVPDGIVSLSTSKGLGSFFSDFCYAS